jgi:DNA-directed RNA polymerase specialized sigma24 family protein
MQQVLIDIARRRKSRRRAEIDPDLLADKPAALDPVDAMDLAFAIDKLKKQDADLAQLARLRVFAGLTISQIAEALNVSKRETERDWAFAKAWLAKCLKMS